MAPDPAGTEPPPPSEQPYPIGWGELAAVAGMLLMFVASQLVAVLLVRPFQASGVEGFQDPTDWKNGLWLFLTVLVFTVLILYIARKRRQRLIQYLILGSVGLTLVYVFFPLLDLIPTPALDEFQITVAGQTVPILPALLLAVPPALLLTGLLYKFPEWYVVDTVGVLVSAGAIAIFGYSFTPVTYLVVLVGFAIYDYVSVYRTKHMLSLADSVLDLHLPIMLVVPKTLDYSFLEERGGLKQSQEGVPVKRERDAMFIGLGDIVIPSIFAVSALPISAYAAMGAFLGTLAGFLLLMSFVLRGRAHAGLPSLNGGALLGFLAGFYLDTGTLRFW